jgi:hypothetical protein
MSLRNIASGVHTLSALEFGSVPLNSVGKGGETITVIMRGQTPAAHADAILAHYKFTKTDEAKFKELYGFDLRQDLTDAYARKDNRAAHTALGKGLYKVEIPIPKELLAQIRAVKEANRQPAAQPQDIKQAVAERNGYDQSAVLRSQIESRLPTTNSKTLLLSVPIPAPAPIPLPDRSEYISAEKVELPTTPENANKLTITIQTFIPMERVDAPNNPLNTPFAPAIGNFEGDGRDVDQRTINKNGKLDAATYRTRQTIDIDLNMPEVVDVPCTVKVSQCISTPNTGISADLSRWDNKTPLRQAQATGETIKATARREGNTIIIEAKEDEGNPLVKGAPGITYDLKIKIEKQADGTMTMTTAGSHDHFPGYEVFVSRPNASESDKKLVYGFDPRTKGNTPLGLFDDYGLAPQQVITKTKIVPMEKKAQ